MYAFWTYHVSHCAGYPSMLGGEVTKMNEQGQVLTVGYGPGCWFRPTFMLPLKSGKELEQKVQALNEEFRTRLNALCEEFKVRAKALFPC